MITKIISKDKSTLIFSAAETIHFLESCTTTPKLSSQKYTSHKSPINSLSISTDNTLLLSTSSNAVLIHNLTVSNTNPSATLRGLPSSRITTGLFHTHTRTRALIGVGKQLLLYDTTRPSGPSKTFTMEGEGEVEIIVCSPFSKTLVAVAMGGAGAGTIGLVDLEKERGLFRTIDTKVPITALSFSPEGASIYAGTETGKLIVIDLRAMDKPPSVVEISGEGSVERVVAMSIQKKSAGTPISASRKPSTTTSSPRRTVSISKPSTPAVKRTVSSSRIVATKAGNIGTTLPSPTAPATKKVFSPLRSPLANSSNRKARNQENGSGVEGEEDFSVKLETLGTIRRGNPRSPLAAVPVSRKGKERDKPSASAAAATLPPTSRTRTVSTSRARSGLTGTTGSPKINTATSTSPTSSKNTTTTATTNSISRVVTIGESISTAGSRRTRIKPTEGDSGSVPPVPPLPKGLTFSAADVGGARTEDWDHTQTRSTTGSKATKTPSPDLPGLGNGGGISDSDRDHEVAGLLPVTPGPAKKGKGLRFRGLGLGVPATGYGSRTHGEGKGKDNCNRKSVEFFYDDGRGGSDGEDEEIQEDEEGIEGDLSIQISPARHPGGQAPLSSDHHHGFNHHNYNTSSNQSPQIFLRSIVQSVLSDFHLQTHRGMTDLHLDLVRMGRGWRSDVREVVREEMDRVVERMVREVKESTVKEIRDGYGLVRTTSNQGMWQDAELRELREENRRLREENEKLTRVVIGGGSG